MQNHSLPVQVDALVRACTGKGNNSLPPLSAYSTQDLEFASRLISSAGDPLKTSPILKDELQQRERIKSRDAMLAKISSRITLNKDVLVLQAA